MSSDEQYRVEANTRKIDVLAAEVICYGITKNNKNRLLHQTRVFLNKV